MRPPNQDKKEPATDCTNLKHSPFSSGIGIVSQYMGQIIAVFYHFGFEIRD
jgi:hypothetical protein